MGPTAIEAVVEDLQLRIQKAIEQLNSLAVEYVHRKNGEQYSEIDADDLQEVVDILNGIERKINK